MISKNKIKYIRSLELKKNRNKEGKFVAEGFKVVDDLLALQPADLIVATQEWLHGKHLADQTEVIEVTEEELKKVSFLQHPQQVLAVFRQDTGCNKQDSNNSQEEAEEKNFGFSKINTQELSLALDGVQDPGNLGTIIRIADWFGIEDIFCSQGTADAFNPKTVQATMGALARVRLHYCDLKEFIRVQTERNVPVFGTFLDGKNIYSQKLSAQGVIVMGNEGNGVCKEIENLVSQKLLIPNYPQGKETSESLNVAVATAIVCAEFRRRLS